MFKVGDTVKVVCNLLSAYHKVGVVVFVKDVKKTHLLYMVEFADSYGDFEDDDLQYVDTRTFDEQLDDRYRHECRPGLPEQAMADEI
jgi:hypothetical protein